MKERKTVAAVERKNYTLITCKVKRNSIINKKIAKKL